MLLHFINSPLEQFEILPFVFLTLGVFDFSITNQTLTLILICFFIITLFFFNFKNNN